MIRLAWRQFRVPAIAGAAALVVVGAIVLLTHPHLVEVYDSTVRGCEARGTCDADGGAFLQVYEAIGGWLGILTVAVPGIIGVFWGAPLVAREIEQGTFRLVWTQSVTRSRWLAVQLGVVGLASAVVAGLISLMVTWWSGLHDGVRADAFRMFDQRDVVPIGYAVVAFVLGVAIGVFVRRVMPAIATTLVAFIAVRFAVTQWIRPALLSPETMTLDIVPERTGYGSHDGEPMSLMPEPPHLPGAWVRSVEVVDESGKRLTAGALRTMCPDIETRLGPPPSGGGVEHHGPAPGEVVDVLHECITKVGRTHHVLATYHPAKTYWTFQWLELGVYLAIAAVLVGACFWGIRRLR